MEVNYIQIYGNKHPKVALRILLTVEGYVKLKKKLAINIYSIFSLKYLKTVSQNKSVHHLTVKIDKYIPNDILEQTTYLVILFSEELNIKNKRFYTHEANEIVVYESEQNFTACNLSVVIETVDNVSYSSSFKTLCDDTELTDFELKGEYGSVHVHRAVLAASSPVLRRMLVGTWRETKEGCVEIRVSTATLQHFKDYIYSGTIPETGLSELLSLAQCYMMPELERQCVFKLFDNISVRKEVQEENSEENDNSSSEE